MFYPVVSLAIVDQGQTIISADDPVDCKTIAKVHVLYFTMWYVLDLSQSPSQGSPILLHIWGL